MNTQTISLDVTKRPVVAPVVYLGQGDKSGTTLVVQVYDNDIALSLSSYTVRFCMRLPDGESYYSVNGTVSGNIATFAIDESYAAAAAGITDKAYVEVISENTVICSTGRFRVVVLEGARAGASPGEQYISEIDDAVADAQAATTAANGAASSATSAASSANSAATSANNAASTANQAASEATSAATAANEAAQAAVTNVKCYYTTETVGDDEVLALVYDLVSE